MFDWKRVGGPFLDIYLRRGGLNVLSYFGESVIDYIQAVRWRLEEAIVIKVEANTKHK